jgi:hypothetical protein
VNVFVVVLSVIDIMNDLELHDHGPSYSPNLNSCNYFLRGFLKDSVFRNNPHTAEELLGEITAAVEKITEDTLTAVMENLSRRHEMDIDHVLNMFYFHKRTATARCLVTPHS